MILLEVYNRIVAEAIRGQLEAPEGKREALEIQCADFDGVLYHVSTDRENNHVNVSLKWGCADQLLQQGALDDLKKIYGDYYRAQPEDGYNVTIFLDLNNIPTGKEAEELPQKFGMLKRHLFATPFQKAFDSVAAGSPSAAVAIDYRYGSETVHIIPGKEAVTVIFSIGFESKGDQVLSKVFLQEFSEARRMVRGAPAVKFSEREPPMELEQLGVQAAPEGNISYVSFVLFSHHIDAKNADHTISYIQTFRNYLHYHLKCSKAYMHSRMRKRVESLLLVLNRSRPPPFEPKQKKTIAGKTFTRAGEGASAAAPAGGRGRARGAGRSFGRGRG